MDRSGRSHLRRSKAAGAGLLLVLASCGDGSMTLTEDPGTTLSTVDREYKGPVKNAHDAALAILQGDHLDLETNRWDELGSEIVARRGADPGSKVRVNVKAVDADTCRVTVRVDPGDRPQAEALQGRIGEKLAGAAK